MANSGMEVVSLTSFDLVSEYLERIYAYAKRKIENRYGDAGMDDVFDNFKVHVRSAYRLYVMIMRRSKTEWFKQQRRRTPQCRSDFRA